METSKPHFDQVYQYAQRQVWYAINKLAPYLPYEQKEEISQNAMLRTWNAYQRLDAHKGWKSYIQTHCNGSVLDYLKGGDRDMGTEIDLERVEVMSDSSLKIYLDIDEIAGLNGVFSSENNETETFKPNWPLLSRLCSKDEDLHIVCKVLMGYSQNSIAAQYVSAHGSTLSRERISQKIHKFFKNLDSPDFMLDPWINQCIYALGLCDVFHMESFDSGIGWDLTPIDLNCDTSFKSASTTYIPSLFDDFNLEA